MKDSVEIPKENQFIILWHNTNEYEVMKSSMSFQKVKDYILENKQYISKGRQGATVLTGARRFFHISADAEEVQFRRAPKVKTSNKMTAEEKKLNATRKRVEQWLVDKHRFINITAIEKTIAAPKGLIQKFVKYDTKIASKWIDPIHSVLKEFNSFKL